MRAISLPPFDHTSAIQRVLSRDESFFTTFSPWPLCTALPSPGHTGEPAVERWPSKASPKIQHPPLTTGALPSISSLIPLVRQGEDTGDGRGRGLRIG